MDIVLCVLLGVCVVILGYLLRREKAEKWKLRWEIKKEWEKIAERQEMYRQRMLQEIIANAMATCDKTIPPPAGYNEAAKAFVDQMGFCGEVLHEIPIAFVEKYPDVAIAWFEEHVMSLYPGYQSLLKKKFV